VGAALARRMPPAARVGLGARRRTMQPPHTKEVHCATLKAFSSG
jgi:hypothetical protein